MTLLAYFLSFFLEKDFGSYFRALCQNNADIRFPRGLPNNRGLVGRFMFKWLKHKLTHKHLEDIAGTVFARYNKTKMVLLLIERNEENILNAHPELLRNTDLSQIPIILDRASRSATDDTAPIVLNVFFIMLDDIKRRMSPNPVATALFNHSLTHGAGLLFWAIDAQLVSDTILNEKLHQKENAPRAHPDVTKHFQSLSAHARLKTTKQISSIQKHPLRALQSPAALTKN